MSLLTMTNNKFLLLPPSPDLCQECAFDHDPDDPHNKDTMYYKIDFYNKNAREPTWTDAMAHCTNDIKEQWTKNLTTIGVMS
jgi:hypothetical protein